MKFFGAITFLLLTVCLQGTMVHSPLSMAGAIASSQNIHQSQLVTQYPMRKLLLQLHHFIGKEALVLGEPFTNILGDTIMVQKFKYYLSNFSIIDDKGKAIKLVPSYFLVDEADSASKTIVLSIPDVTVTGIRFLLGVDSIKNVSGIQSGALDPLKGMFWTWNSGYVMAKLEGSSTSSTIAGSSFQYHVGGFRTPMNTLRMIDLPATVEKDANTLSIHADINRWFQGNSVLSIAETPVCHSPGPLAVRIADNYRYMFSIQNTH
jgi:hypothetical protein